MASQSKQLARIAQQIRMVPMFRPKDGPWNPGQEIATVGSLLIEAVGMGIFSGRPDVDLIIRMGRVSGRNGGEGGIAIELAQCSLCPGLSREHYVPPWPEKTFELLAVAVEQAALAMAEAGGGAAPAGKPLPDNQGNWLTPTTLTDMANRLGNIGPKKARSILNPYGLKRAGAGDNRQSWTVCLDRMPENMIEQLTRN